MNETRDQTLLDFAKRHEINLITSGEVGFGRDCVGFSKERGFVDYRPLDMGSDMFDEIAGFEGDRIGDIAPEDAYHKHACLAVLVVDGGTERALDQLCDWVNGLNAMDVEVVEYQTGANGMQAMLSGATGYAVRPKVPKT